MPAARLNLCPEIAAMMMNPSVPPTSKASLLCLAAFTAGLWAGEPPEADPFASAFMPSQAVYVQNRASANERMARLRSRKDAVESVTVTRTVTEEPIKTDASTPVDKRHCDGHSDAPSINIKDSLNITPEEGVQGEPGSVTVTRTVTPRFQKPTIADVRAYCSERNNGIDARTFVDFYESKGWMVGKNHMKDWKAAVRTWERGRSFSNSPSSGQRAAIANPAGGREGQFDGLW